MANPLDTFTLDAVDYFFERPFRVEVVPRSAIDDYFRTISADTASERSAEAADDGEGVNGGSCRSGEQCQTRQQQDQRQQQR
ncbi:hypothetical protein EON65_56470 [archaeon]|nr:MAG: hypothetical protein EON65_56470 [archaeon]